MKFPLLILAALLANISLANTNLLITPTEAVTQSVHFADDLDYTNLLLAIERQQEYFTRAPLTGQIKFGQDIYPREVLAQSLDKLKSLIQKYQLCVEALRNMSLPFGNEINFCQNELNKLINRQFKLYKPLADLQRRDDIVGAGRTLYTAYYSPDFHGSYTQTEVYKYPIYALPETRELRVLSRKEIDFEGKLQGKNLELFYVREGLFDLYLLQVEGGGRVRVETPEGIESHYISYAGANGQPFRFIYKYLIEQGLLPEDQAGLEQQRQFLSQHPERQAEVYSSNPSYVYFKMSDEEPMGVGNIPLTSGRSMAVDSRVYSQPGLLNFVAAKKPYLDNHGQVRYKNFSRFFLSQDTGGAIKGNARADLYMGFGREAEIQANNLKYYGDQYFLVALGEKSNNPK